MKAAKFVVLGMLQGGLSGMIPPRSIPPYPPDALTRVPPGSSTLRRQWTAFVLVSHLEPLLRSKRLLIPLQLNDTASTHGEEVSTLSWQLRPPPPATWSQIQPSQSLKIVGSFVVRWQESDADSAQSSSRRSAVQTEEKYAGGASRPPTLANICP